MTHTGIEAPGGKPMGYGRTSSSSGLRVYLDRSLNGLMTWISPETWPWGLAGGFFNGNGLATLGLGARRGVAVGAGQELRILP
jgi:hypothetical protein